MIRVLYSLLITILTIFIFVQCGIDSNTVATVGSEAISVDEFTKLLKQRYPKVNGFKEIEEKTKRDILNQATVKKQQYLAALDNNLDEDPEVIEAVNKQEENLLGQKYYEVIIVDKLLSKEEIDNFNLRQGYSFKTAHIIIGYKGAKYSADRTKQEAMDLAKSVLEKVKNGENFNQLIFEFSDDPQAKNPHAQGNTFKWGQKGKEYEQACWELNVGEVSDIIATPFGYYIIRLDEKTENPDYKPDNSPQNILNIKRTLYNTVADSGKKMWEKHIEELKESKSFTINEQSINRTAQLLAEAIKNKNITADQFSDEDKNIKLASWDDGDITLNTIWTRYSNNLSRVFSALKDPSKLKREIQNLSLITMAVAEARQMGLDNDEIIKSSLDELRQSRMEYLVGQRMVNDKVEFTDEEVKKYYEENPDQFMNPEKREMWEITFADEETAKRVANMAKKGSNFEKLARKYSTSKYYKDKGGYLGFRTINSRGTISKKAFEMEADGAISDPFKFKKEWAIVKTGKVEAKKLRPFQEVSRMVEGRLRNDLLKKRREEWSEELNNKYPVNINEEVLKNI